MATVFFKYNTTAPGNQKVFEQPGEGEVANFLTKQDWIQCGTDAFHSKPTFGTVKEQHLSQAKAIADIQKLFKTRPWLKERVSNTLIITGTAYNLDSLLKQETRNNEVKGHDSHKESTRGSLAKSKLHLDLKACHSFSDSKNNDQARLRQSNVKDDRKKHEAVQSTGKTRLVRNSGFKDSTMTNLRNFKVHASTKTAATSKLHSTSLTRFNADVNLNNLANKKHAHMEENNESQDLTPLIMNLSHETPTPEFREWLSTVKCLYVETLVRKEKGFKRLACQTFNKDPSQQVVV